MWSLLHIKGDSCELKKKIFYQSCRRFIKEKSPFFPLNPSESQESLEQSERRRERWEQKQHRRRRLKQRSISREKWVETLVVADTKMVQFHGSDNIEKYVLTVMNMVSAGPCRAGTQGTMEPWNALGGERLQAHPGAPPDTGRVTFHRPGGIPGGTLANPHQQVVPTLPSPLLPCPVPRPCGGWAGGSKPEA